MREPSPTPEENRKGPLKAKMIYTHIKTTWPANAYYLNSGKIAQ